MRQPEPQLTQRTSNKITSGGNRNPANAGDPDPNGGQDRRRFIPTASPPPTGMANAAVPFNPVAGLAANDQQPDEADGVRALQNMGPVTFDLVQSSSILLRGDPARPVRVIMYAVVHASRHQRRESEDFAND